ncbi:MAG TPA: type VI secretion system lipoprotein TssJ [Paraburkholderia sp.]|nr:type VI secretion system lipoprotein TssJ [Paraburkholderia sp.]
MSWRIPAFTAVCIGLLAGCGAWQAASDASVSAYRAVFTSNVKTLNVDLSADETLNPDETGHPTPVVVRIYQLRDRKAFDSVSRADLAKGDRTLLATDLNAELSAVLNPGASASLSQRMQPGTQFVAIVVLYRTTDADGAWKQVIATKKLRADAALKVMIDADQVRLQDDAAGHGRAS